MTGLLDFFTKEAGQKRRQWLDEKDAELAGLLSYFAGPHATDAASKAGGLLASMSDGADFQEYWDAGRNFVGSPSFGGGAELAAAGAALMVPGLSKRALDEAIGGVNIAENGHRLTFSKDGGVMDTYPDGGDLYIDITEVPEAKRRQGISTALHDAGMDWAEARGGNLYSGYELTDDGRAYYEGMRRKGYGVELVELPNGEEVYKLTRPKRAIGRK